jgi:hypothetical protein
VVERDRVRTDPAGDSMTTGDKVLDMCCWTFIVLIAFVSFTLGALACVGVIQ